MRINSNFYNLLKVNHHRTRDASAWLCAMIQSAQPCPLEHLHLAQQPPFSSPKLSQDMIKSCAFQRQQISLRGSKKHLQWRLEFFNQSLLLMHFYLFFVFTISWKFNGPSTGLHLLPL